jgi:hypothetical protein
MDAAPPVFLMARKARPRALHSDNQYGNWLTQSEIAPGAKLFVD